MKQFIDNPDMRALWIEFEKSTRNAAILIRLPSGFQFFVDSRSYDLQYCRDYETGSIACRTCHRIKYFSVGFGHDHSTYLFLQPLASFLTERGTPCEICLDEYDVWTIYVRAVP